MDHQKSKTRNYFLYINDYNDSINDFLYCAKEAFSPYYNCIYFFFNYSHGLNFDDHGYFNFFYYCVLISLFSTILMPFDYILKQKKENNIIKIIIIYLQIIIYSNYFLSNSQKNCNDWGKGLNNTFIENDSSKYGCQIQFPKLCIYKILEYFQDYSKLLRKNCKNYKNGKLLRSKILKNSLSSYINDKTTRIGYPLFNKDLKCFLDYPGALQNYFYNNIIDMDNKTLLEKYFKEKLPEVEINFNNINDPKLIINLHYNKSLKKGNYWKKIVNLFQIIY